jgi:membrane-anchored protein YejM (alkaline phosphatase superfamily)
LHKAWLRSGIGHDLCVEIGSICDDEGQKITKRKQRDVLYQQLRNSDYNRRLEISRNFVRILIEHTTFVPQHEKHRIQTAERAALKLKELLSQQKKDREYREGIKRRARKASVEDYYSQLLKLREEFITSQNLPAQERGYALEKISWS